MMTYGLKEIVEAFAIMFILFGLPFFIVECFFWLMEHRDEKILDDKADKSSSKADSKLKDIERFDYLRDSVRIQVRGR